MITLAKIAGGDAGPVRWLQCRSGKDSGGLEWDLALARERTKMDLRSSGCRIGWTRRMGRFGQLDG